MSWRDLELGNPELAADGAARLLGKPAYLATLRADGSPRVHPTTPIIGAGRLFLFMEPTSPKGRDLDRDARYALHCGVDDNSGGGGEFHVRGTARRVSDAESRALAAQSASYKPADRYVLFEFDVDEAGATEYVGAETCRRLWKKPA